MSDDIDVSVSGGKGRLGENVQFPDIVLDVPGWIRRQVDWTRLYYGDRDRMRVALFIAQQNIEQKTGGPFGAAIFDAPTGRLIAAAANRTARPHTSALLHAELIAIAMAEQSVGSLADGDYELHTSCEPCLMCLGAVALSGLRRVVSSTGAAEAAGVGIDAAPAPGEAWDTLTARGIDVQHGVLRDEGRDVLAYWRACNGPPQR